MKVSEHLEQAAVIRWARLNEDRLPELRLLFAVPNGGWRHISVASNLKAEGVKAGVPDLFLPVARQGKHGLFIEMKSLTGTLKKEQKQWRDDLIAEGYEWACCKGHEIAIATIERYLSAKT